MRHYSDNIIRSAIERAFPFVFIKILKLLTQIKYPLPIKVRGYFA
nr:MAG TPA: hypothetical protein [Caudoviricetes sp.]